MTSISSLNTAALLILQQGAVLDPTRNSESTSPDLAAIANGIADKVGVSTQPGRAESKISEAMFSVNNVNINKLKIELIDRTAEALGFDRQDYESIGQFSSAMRVSVVSSQQLLMESKLFRKSKKNLA